MAYTSMGWNVEEDELTVEFDVRLGQGNRPVLAGHPGAGSNGSRAIGEP